MSQLTPQQAISTDKDLYKSKDNCNGKKIPIFFAIQNMKPSENRVLDDGLKENTRR